MSSDAMEGEYCKMLSVKQEGTFCSCLLIIMHIFSNTLTLFHVFYFEQVKKDKKQRIQKKQPFCTELLL